MDDNLALLAWETYLNIAPWPEHEGLTVANVKAAFLAGTKLHADELASLRTQLAEAKAEIERLRGHIRGQLYAQGIDGAEANELMERLKP